MDVRTSQAIRDIVGSLHEQVAPLLSDLIALLERAHEEERRQLRAERAALDRDREAVNLARRSLEAEREALARERDAVAKEKLVAQRWRDADDALEAAGESIQPES